MITLASPRRRSWLVPADSRYLAWKVGVALEERFKGKVGLMITLTYDRTPYSNALACYRAGQDERHVRRFIARLEKAIGEDLTGKWWRKLEFQEQGGWPHFHLIVETAQRIPHDLLQETWGHGYTYVQRVTPQRCRYAAKYIAKPDEIPAWLYLERQRGVKIVACSPGFWPDALRRQSRSVKKAPPPIYVPIGEVLVQTLDGHTVLRDGFGGYKSVPGLDRYAVAACCLAAGMRVEARDGEIVVVGSIDGVMAAVGAASGDSRGRPLHLNQVCNPPRRPPEVRPRWLCEYYTSVGALLDEVA